jgi:hypothetical protein
MSVSKIIFTGALVSAREGVGARRAMTRRLKRVRGMGKEGLIVGEWLGFATVKRGGMAFGSARRGAPS